MNTTRRIERDESARDDLDVLVIGGGCFGLAIAEYLAEWARSVTFAAEVAPADCGDGVKAIQREVRDASDVRSLASDVTDVDLVITAGSDSQALLTGCLARREFPCAVVAGVDDPANGPAFDCTGVDRISIPRLLAERIRERYE